MPAETSGVVTTEEARETNHSISLFYFFFFLFHTVLLKLGCLHRQDIIVVLSDQLTFKLSGKANKVIFKERENARTSKLDASTNIPGLFRVFTIV